MIDEIPENLREIPSNGLGIFYGEYIYMMGVPFILMSCIAEPDIDAAESFLVFNGQVIQERIRYSDLLKKATQYARESVQKDVLASVFRKSLFRLRGIMSKNAQERPDIKYLFPERIEFVKVDESAFRIQMCVSGDRLADLKIISGQTISAALRAYIDGILAMSELVTIERPA